MQDPPIWQRLLAALAYLLPWSDAIPFGQGLFGPLPWLRWLALPALPVLQLQEMVPFGSLLLFLLLFLAVVRNPRVPYGIRFNVLQAILIDIVLVLLSLAFNILLAPLSGSLGFLVRTLQNTVFLGALLLVFYAVIQNLRGQQADIPTVSEAVRMQLF
ncbi:MAG: Tic20 family protein [Cyanobacteriota bacterium]|nr:Tic20 family protein [Cyanobacteriota bacterium]